jgi:hypothetical protein
MIWSVLGIVLVGASVYLAVAVAGLLVALAREAVVERGGQRGPVRHRSGGRSGEVDHSCERPRGAASNRDACPAGAIPPMGSGR